ncbi:MAG TPA: hypothetical protein VHD62_14110 [Opitutaceae bacterium]|nr:hypothetical protein [Opitutaceae bacterium]
MAIEKESSGFPEIDPHRPTTKVNLAMIVAIGVFFVVVYVIVWFMAHQSGNTRADSPSGPTENLNSNAPEQSAPPAKNH